MKRIRFEYDNPHATSVSLAADFTDWAANARPMRRSKGDGPFVTTVPLPPGEYEYKFVVDGEWREDPKADPVPNHFGTHNSRLTITAATRGRKAA